MENQSNPSSSPTLFFASRNWVLWLSIALFFALVWYFIDIVTYVLVAWVVSLLGQPLMRFFKKIKYKKIRIPVSVAAILTLATFFLILAGLFYMFVPLIIEQAANLSKVDWTTLVKGLETPINDLNTWAIERGLLENGKNAADEIRHLVVSNVQISNVSGLFRYIISMASGFGIGFISVLFISFFFLSEQKMFSEFLATLVPKHREDDVREAVTDTTTLLTRYFSGLLLQMLFVFTFLSIILGFGFHIQNALVIAVFASIINVVPYLGPILGFMFSTLIIISSNLQFDFYTQTFPLIMKVGFTFSFMQFLNDWIVQPLIFSNRVLAHPLEIFLITLIGAKVGGIGGMILAIPTYTVFRVIAREFFNEYKIIQKMTESLDEVV